MASPRQIIFFTDTNKQPETWQHLLQCQETTPSSWRQKLFTDLNHLCQELLTDPGLKSVLLLGLNNCFNSTCGFQASALYGEYHQLYIEQTRIGWHSFIQGKIHKKWDKLQNDFQNRNLTVQHITKPKSWSISVLTLLWTSWLNLWTQRNQVVHGLTKSESQSIERSKMLQDIRSFIQEKDKITPHLRQALPTSIQKLESSSWHALKTWCSLYQDSIKTSIAEFPNRLTRGMRSLQFYFSPRILNHGALHYQDLHAPSWEEGATPLPQSPLNQSLIPTPR